MIIHRHRHRSPPSGWELVATIMLLLLTVSVVVGTARCDTVELLSSAGLPNAQFVDINDHGTVAGYVCFDGCGTLLWTLNGSHVVRPVPDYLVLKIAADTFPVDLNNADQLLIWSFPYAWGLPGELYLPTYASFSLSAPADTPPCPWDTHGFAGSLGVWCGIDQGFIEPIVIEDGSSQQADWSLWHGDGLHSRNAAGQVLEPCVGECEDPALNAYIAGYVETPQSSDPATVPEPGTWLLLGSVFVLLCCYRRIKS